jgi:hypothetical protein
VNGPSLSTAYPALALWRREVRAEWQGQRADGCATWRLDALWRAASWEQAAREAEQDGQLDIWRHSMQRARETFAEAVAARRSVA